MFIFSFFSFREFSLPALANRALAIILCAAAFTFPHSARADSPPALLLAQNYAGGVDLGEYWVSEKLDGVRARWDGANLISRNGNRFAAPAWFTANFPAAKLDGELWMGRGRFEQTVSVVRRAAPHDGWREVRFMVFDMPRAGGDFNARLRQMKTTVAAAAQRNRHIALVEQFTVRDHRALVERMREVAAAGGEGLMLHRGGAFYRSGRSRDLLKLKPFDDAEATVIAHHRGAGKIFRGDGRDDGGVGGRHTLPHRHRLHQCPAQNPAAAGRRRHLQAPGLDRHRQAEIPGVLARAGGGVRRRCGVEDA